MASPGAEIPPDVERYFDYNATTPIHPDVVSACSAALRNTWGNASSSGHALGRKAKSSLDEARTRIANAAGCATGDILLTSGGTEASNLVLTSQLHHYHLLYGPNPDALPHFVVGPCEHPALIEPLRALERQGKVSVTEVPLDPPAAVTETQYLSEVCAGAPSPQAIVSALTSATVLVSVMLVNNETGAVADIARVSEAVRIWESTMSTSAPRWRRHRVYVHTDIAQALGKVEVHLDGLGVDYATIVGHKFYGPRIGALFSRGLGQHPSFNDSLGAFPTSPDSAPLYPAIRGGGQERGYRSGTENLGMAVGLGEAAFLVSKHIKTLCAHLSAISSLFINLLETTHPRNIVPIVHHKHTPRAPNVVSFSLIERDILADLKSSRLPSRASKLRAWDVQSALVNHEPSFIVARGAACHADTGDEIASATLMAVPGMAKEVALNTIRWSCGWWSKEEEVQELVKALWEVVPEV
ncbi:hypothetical protein HDU93_002783 [Gonapodya sp. JEL0774]|nr:hypothetical protein HDU93_002783 [Gonapodya sp. JEL0774]